MRDASSRRGPSSEASQGEASWSEASPAARVGVRRGTSLLAAVVMVLAMLLWAWGAGTPGALAHPGSDSGGAILLGLLVDTLIDGVLVALWLASAVGMGQRLLGLLGASSLHEPRAARADASADDTQTPASDVVDHSGGVDTLFSLVTACALGIGMVGIFALALGLLGALSRGTAWGLIAVGIAVLPWHERHALGPWLRTRSPGAGVAWLLVIPFGLMLVAASMLPGILWKPFDPHPYDVVSYHLQIPREWYELGRIVPLDHNSFSFFPAGQEIHSLLAMHLLGGPWAGMYAAQLMATAFAGLTVLAVVGGVRTLGGRRGAFAWLSGLLAASVPWTIMLGSVAYVESGVMLYSTLAVVWAMAALNRRDSLSDAGRGGAASAALFPQGPDLSHAVLSDAAPSRAAEAAPPRPGPPRPAPLVASAMVVAGLCAGLAGGIKYTALAMTAVPLLALYPLFAWRTRTRWARPWLLGGVGCVIAMSPWLVRNIAWTGNPVFPLAPGVLGHGHFTPDQIDRYAVAHAPPASERSVSSRLHAAWQRVAVDPQFAYGLLPLTLAAIALTIRPPAGRAAGASGTGALGAGALGAGMLGIGAGVWLLATHDMPRFLAPTIPLAAVLCGVAFGRSRRTRGLGGGAMAVIAAAGIGWTISALRPTLDLGRQGLFRLTDPSAVVSEDVQRVLQSGGKLALVGDAQAFLYPFPAGRLNYRGVFDVVVPPGVSLADGWLGTPVAQLRAEGWWVLVSPSELGRLSGSYEHLPRPAPPFEAGGATVLLPPTRAGVAGEK